MSKIENSSLKNFRYKVVLKNNERFIDILEKATDEIINHSSGMKKILISEIE